MCFIYLNTNKRNKIQETNKIISRDDLRFIIGHFGAKEIKSDSLIRKYFQVLDNFVPYANVIFGVSEYTMIDPIVIQHKNITINIVRYGNQTIKTSNFFFIGIRNSFYLEYLKNHSEIKYVVISDSDTLFFRDPFPFIDKDPNIVHIMEDIFPFSRIKDGNYIWTNAWACLDKKIKEKCGFKELNKHLLSNEIKNRIPLNSGLLLGNSKNIIKIFELISTRLNCPGQFHNNADQGLLNYLDLSGELNELNISIRRHNIYNGSFLSCPNYLPKMNYIQQVNSLHFIAIHHYQLLNRDYIESSPKEFQSFLKK